MGWKEDAENGTPGPWDYDCGCFPPDGPGRYSDIYSPADDGIIIASFNEMIPEGMANARRIARVPAYEEALRAAEAMAAFVEHNHPESISLIAFRKAMKKL